MRIKEELKKSGYFWLPSAPENPLPGTLSITDGGEIELEIIGFFDESTAGINASLVGNDEIELQRIIGCIESNGQVTLENCFYKTKSIQVGGVSKSSIIVNQAFIGIAYDDAEAILLNTFQFSVEGIDEWVGVSGIKVDPHFEHRTALITYVPPEDISINLCNGLKLIINFQWTLPGFPSTTEAKITQKTYFKIASEEARPLDDFMISAYKLTTLLCFAIDKIVCIDKINVTSDAIYQDIGGGKKIPVNISLYYASLPYTKSEPKIDRHHMLFRYGQIRDDAERIIRNWFNAYDVIDPALNLYFSVKAGDHKYLDSKFLALAQALETFHRRTSNKGLMDHSVYLGLIKILIDRCPDENKEWLYGRLLHGNEVSLGQRIKDIIEPFKKVIGSCKSRNKVIRSIVDTRNYLTHYDDSLKVKAVTGRGLWLLCLEMEAIFQLHLLNVLGFTPTEVESILNDSHQLQKKIKPNIIDCASLKQ